MLRMPAAKRPARAGRLGQGGGTQSMPYFFSAGFPAIRNWVER